jgi:hypothetical protein
MPKINIVENIVGNLTLDLKKLFDKGEIDKLYNKMYEVADTIAGSEAARYENLKRLEHYHELSISDPRGPMPSTLKVVRQVRKFRNTRLDLHLRNMCHLLEIYAQAKTKNHS